MHTVNLWFRYSHYEHGKIGQWKVNEPMVLGHEGSGTIVGVGENQKFKNCG